MLRGPRRWITLLACSACSQVVLRAEEPVLTLSRHPYIQSTTPTSAVIVWRTRGQGVPSVRYGPSPDALTHILAEGVTKFPPKLAGGDEGLLDDVPRLHSAPDDTFQYEFTLSNLNPLTRTYYAIYDQDTLLAGGDDEHFAQTLPPPGVETPMRFWVVGDSGDGGLWQRVAYAVIKTRVEESARPIDAYVHLGDMAYQTGLDNEFQANFFDIYTTLLRNTVTWPTMGNHEGITSSGLSTQGPYYDAYVVPTRGEAGGAPSGTESYYSFDCGTIHFVCLNSHDIDRRPEGEMALWLREDLSRTSAKWLITFFHHPPYTKGTHDSDWELQLREMREHVMPILESHGVDLVLAGHSHTYERSMLINGAYATPTVADGVVLDDSDGDPAGQGAYQKSAGLKPNEGTIAVVAGNGRGALQYFGTMPIMRRTIPQVGSVLLDFDGDRMTGHMVTVLNEVVDTFQIIKSGDRAAPLPLEHPWQPFGPRVSVGLLGDRHLKVVIVPNPPAPDALVRYTLDGSDITADSPIYDSPLILGKDVYLRTRSTWRGGQRESPETRAEWIRADAPRSVDLPLLSGADDAIAIDDVVDSAGATLSTGQGTLAFRFTDLQVPPNVTISRAYLQFSGAAAGAERGHLRIRAEKSAHSSPLSATEQPISTRSVTASEVVWDVPAWLFPMQRSTLQRTPDLSRILQELVESDSWTTGADLTFLIDGDVVRTIAASESAANSVPVLKVEYEPLPPMQAAITQKLTIEEIVAGDQTQARLSFRRLTGYAGDRFTYHLEGSSDLTPGSWLPLEGWEEETSTVVEGSWQFYRFLHKAPLKGPRFIRFRITEAR